MRIIDQSWRGAVLRHELFAASGGAPCVILLPTVMGVSDLERRFAARLVGEGYTAVVADMFGRRFAPGEREAAMAAMQGVAGRPGSATRTACRGVRGTARL